MTQSIPNVTVADSRAAGAQCPHCVAEVEYGDNISTCQACGTVHHMACWDRNRGCGAYDCAPDRRPATPNQAASLKITGDELDCIVPTVSTGARSIPVMFPHSPTESAAGRGRTNGMAKAALAVGIVGIPLFGLLTGLIAIVLGSVAVGTIRDKRQRGTGLAVAGILLGVADMVGWIVFLAFAFPSFDTELDISDFEPDMAALDKLSPQISRAMKANVLITTHGKWAAIGESGLGSGVILQIDDNKALIVTNRHVVDPDFSDSDTNNAGLPPDLGRLSVKLIGQPTQPGQVRWIAPGGIDLALVTVTLFSDEPQTARWEKDAKLEIGADVFAIGNPHGLGWTHTRGGISQLRIQKLDGRKIRVIQTSAAINPGNSGGGLYDKEGRLIGINTWTNDKRVSEGLSFSITFETFLKLASAELNLQESTDEPDES